jgi:hypothetical protein
VVDSVAASTTHTDHFDDRGELLWKFEFHVVGIGRGWEGLE